MFRAKQTSLVQKNTGAEKKRKTERADQRIDCTSTQNDAQYGTEKLHIDLKEQLKNLRIKIGKDKFLQFCREQHLLVPKTKRCFITTDSKHFYYKSPNRIKDMLPTHAEQVFVADITYIK